MKRQIDTETFPTEKLPNPRDESVGYLPVRATPKDHRANVKTSPPVESPKYSVRFPIRATLIGSDHCEALGITGQGSAPVLALCRALVAAGHDTRRPLHVHRRETLALVVGSIGDGAKLRVATHGIGFERIAKCTGGPPARQIAPTIVRPGPAHKRVYGATRNGKFHLSGKRRRR
jgi:hypothetical protein